MLGMPEKAYGFLNNVVDICVLSLIDDYKTKPTIIKLSAFLTR